MSHWLKVSEPISHVLHVELNRNPVNAFSTEFWTAYGEVFDSIGTPTDTRDIRVVMLSSALPKLFTAGLDLNDTGVLSDAVDTNMDSFRRSIAVRSHITEFQNAIGAPERCPVPVIAAVHGKVLGLGIDIISACDVRYSSEDAEFSIKEVDVGLAADIGTLSYLPKIMANHSLARELAFSAAPFSAATALHPLGLVSKVVQGGREGVITAALDLARLIAAKSPVAVLGTKRLINHARDNSLADSLHYTSVWNALALQTDDTLEAIGSVKGKRSPKYAALVKKAKL